MSNTNLILLREIEKSIYVIRGEKVMLDRDLAKLYGVPTGAVNQAVRRNRERFPEDFMFQLTPAEVVQLNLSQIVIGSEASRPSPSTLRIYRTRRRYAVECLTKQVRDNRKHRNHARICKAPTNTCIQHGTCSPPGRTRKQVRQTIQSYLCRYSTVDDNASSRSQRDRLPLAPKEEVIFNTTRTPERGGTRAYRSELTEQNCNRIINEHSIPTATNAMTNIYPESLVRL